MPLMNELRSLCRMIQFAKAFAGEPVVAALSQHLCKATSSSSCRSRSLTTPG
ncbi:hypothetical protein [Zoogloea sp.]|uniref:hypothetical protein n=1 Tax=Zoogloea sp. TaxID=49181 RepID=UPI002639F9C8|nr:hypothetical protein [uncultured Zoogloea sp.]